MGHPPGWQSEHLHGLPPGGDKLGREAVRLPAATGRRTSGLTFVTLPNVSLQTRIRKGAPAESRMDQQAFQQVNQNSPEAIPTEMRRIEGREWWMWGFAVAVTLALTLGIVSFTFPWFNRETDVSYWFDLREWVRGLAALVLLFDFYAVYQHMQLHRIRRQLAERDQLFQLISENAADMIALVDGNGRRLYNSPAYQKVLGYTPEELAATSAVEHIHPDDRARVQEAAEKARRTGRGGRLEYRVFHKDG